MLIASATPVLGNRASPSGNLMPSKTTEQPKETWRDWMPLDSADPSPLLSRVEFLERLSRRGFDVEERSLRFWEHKGVLPRAVLRWDPDAKAPRAYYPLWMFAPVVLLHELQRGGMPLRDISPRLRAIAESAIQENEESPYED